jgi:carboxymethylenebutenolidase
MRTLLLIAPVLLLAGCSSVAGDGTTVEKVVFPSGKDRVEALLHRPEGTGRHPAVLVIHGDFGRTPAIEREAHLLARRGYAALAVDLYRGEQPKDLMEAHILDRALPDERVRGDLRAAADYLLSRPDVRSGGLGAIGWDSGGGHALEAALADRRISAVVTCYGRLVTDPARLKPLEASVLGIFAGKDEGITAETREAFRAAMKKAKKNLAGLHVYDTCDQGFLHGEASASPSVDAGKAAVDAWEKIETFLAAELGR